MRLLSPGKANNNTTFVIAGRLFTAFPPVPRLQDLGQTGSLRFDAELRTALASFPAFLGSEVQNVQKLHTGMPKLPFVAEAGGFLAGSLKSKTAQCYPIGGRGLIVHPREASLNITQRMCDLREGGIGDPVLWDSVPR